VASRLHPSFGITMIHDTSDEEIETTGKSAGGKLFALTVFSCGRQAVNLRTIQAGDARKSWVVQALQSLFGEEAKDVLSHSEVDWSSQGYIGGAYAALPAPGSFTSNRSDPNQTFYELMASSNGHIHFAGKNILHIYSTYIAYVKRHII
jgi:monoamine oxidase